MSFQTDDWKTSDDDVTRPLPHSVSFEKSVLSTMLQDPQEFIPLAIARGITGRHFYLPAHALLFGEIIASFSAGKEIELVSLVQHLLDTGKLDRVGGPSTVTDLYTYAPSPGHFHHHAEGLHTKFKARETIRIANNAIASVYDSPDEIPLTLETLGHALGEIEAGGDRRLQLQPFDFFHADHLEGTSEALDFVEGLLTEGGASVIYGPSNCGKSFWIVDLGVAVASGAPFRDELEVEQGAVVYIALEGSHGAKNRIAALKQAERLKPGDPFFLIFEAVSLLENGHAGRLAETVAKIADQSGSKVRLVILDTMARAMAGGDENSGVDMTAAVKSIDAIRAATGAHVAIVHHCGKDEARGARGHSSLRAAVDTEIEVSRAQGESISTVRVTKQRDMQAGEAMPFSLEAVTIGTDRRGKPITSCIVKHEDEMMASKPGKSGRKPTCTPEEMLEYLPADSIKVWQERVTEETGLGRSQFYDHKRHLEAGNRVRKTPTGGIQKS